MLIKILLHKDRGFSAGNKKRCEREKIFSTENKIIQILIFLTFSESSVLAQSKVNHYLIGCAKDYNLKTVYYTKIFPIEVGTAEDGNDEKDSRATKSMVELSTSLETYVLKNSKSVHFESCSFYSETLEEVEK